MKKYYRLVVIYFCCSLLISCSVEKSPINYGKDACVFCQMNIVDQQHAAQIVTSKGKPFKYDAIECMMRDLQKWDEKELALILITDYSNPGVLVDAEKSTFLISENLPSPMGANLTGFSKKEIALQTKNEKGGKIFSWEELKEQFRKR